MPQIGWNRLEDVQEELALAAGLEVAYYANSFVCRPATDSDSPVVAWSEHEGDRFPAMVRRGLVVGSQFHPEKSSGPGVRFIHAFLDAALRERARVGSRSTLEAQ